MTQFLKFHEWKQQTTTQQFSYVWHGNYQVVRRVKDGRIFKMEDTVSLIATPSKKYKIVSFNKDMLMVVLFDLGKGGWLCRVTINELAHLTT